MNRTTRRRAARTLCVALAGCVASACTMRVPPPPMPGIYPSYRASLTLRDGSQATLRQITVQSDSIIGMEASGGAPVRRAYALADVASAEYRQADRERTVTAAASATAVVVIAASVWAIVSLIQSLDELDL